MKRFFVLLFMLLATLSLASAQTINIKGTVIDENGEPVAGASVIIKGTTKGRMAEPDGSFTMSDWTAYYTDYSYSYVYGASTTLTKK